MIRNFKALGLALVAVLAMGALVASAAQANSTSAKFTMMDGTYPETVHGSHPAGKETLTLIAGIVACASTYGGTTANEASQTITVHPTYTNCKAFGFLSATVNTTGCDYVFHLTTKVPNVNPPKYQAHLTIECSGANRIIITSSGCEVAIGSQSLTTVDLTNNAATTDVSVLPTVTGITYSVLKDNYPCTFEGTGVRTDGTYTTHEPITITSTTAGTKGIHIG